MNKIHDFNDKNILSCNITDGKITGWSYGNDILPYINIRLKNKVNVFYNYYKPEEKKRQREILYCFDKLLKNKKIDNFYVLCSDEIVIDDDKLIKIRINNQPKYKDFFNLINYYTDDEDINIIINSDCYIEEKDINIIKENLNEDEAYLLSRWEILSLKPFKIKHFDNFFNDFTGCSQDAWIFKGYVKKLLNGDFNLGKAGCDNAIAYEFYNAGYQISNPSKSIKIYHYHLTNIRTYGDYSKREENRVKSEYKFIPSTFIQVEQIDENKNIIFYNHYHNGDIHYSREFIKDIMKKYKAKSYSYYFDLEHVGSEKILADINISYRKNIPDEILQTDTMTVIDNDVYLNTWVGQKNRTFVDNIGINLDANYMFYKEIYKTLGIEIENMEYYIPTIDYNSLDLNKCNKFLNNHKNKLKILISNGIVRSDQCENFDLNASIDVLSNRYKDIIFILTDSKDKLIKENIFYTNDIIGEKFDLNEISYLSLSCDIIIGRSSGPYAFSMVKENLNNGKKIMICLSKKKEFEWYISENCKHIVSDKYKTEDLVNLISDEINYLKTRKIRIAFTIILNGLHHLKHNNYAEYISEFFDYWVIVEGAVNNNGSTSWCKKMPDKYHKKGRSIDGTVEYLDELCKKHDNIIFIKSKGIWESKDNMVNRAIDEVKKLTDKCFLWEIDIDEQWTSEQIIKSEKYLIESRAKTGKFNVIQFVGENLITEGKDWSGNPFIRLWNWEGEYFEKHEPPTLKTNDSSIVLIPYKLKHYSFYFEQDVKFKNDWYSDHEGLYDNWLKLKYEENFPQHITYLFPKFNGSEHLANNDDLDCRIIKYDKNLENSLFNKFINKTYVINLKRRPDRLKHITKEFDRIGVLFKRFNAIDGKNIGEGFKSSQIACLRSHISVIKESLEKGYDKIAVFEDDIIFCDDFEKRFEYYSKNVPQDWDIMYLGCHFGSCKNPILIKNYIYRTEENYGCFAMILNNKNKLFEKIIEVTKDESKAIDNYFHDDILKIFKAYVFIPFFVKTLNTISDINDSNESYSYEVVDKHFKNIIDLSDVIETIKEIKKPIIPVEQKIIEVKNEYIKSQREICEDYIRGISDFQIIYNNRVLFDSYGSDRSNLIFFDSYFTLYGRQFSYQGMFIKRK